MSEDDSPWDSGYGVELERLLAETPELEYGVIRPSTDDGYDPSHETSKTEGNSTADSNDITTDSMATFDGDFTNADNAIMPRFFPLTMNRAIVPSHVPVNGPPTDGLDQPSKGDHHGPVYPLAPATADQYPAEHGYSSGSVPQPVPTTLGLTPTPHGAPHRTVTQVAPATRKEASAVTADPNYTKEAYYHSTPQTGLPAPIPTNGQISHHAGIPNIIPATPSAGSNILTTHHGSLAQNVPSGAIPTETQAISIAASGPTISLRYAKTHDLVYHMANPSPQNGISLSSENKSDDLGMSNNDLTSDHHSLTSTDNSTKTVIDRHATSDNTYPTTAVYLDTYNHRQATNYEDERLMMAYHSNPYGGTSDSPNVYKAFATAAGHIEQEITHPGAIRLTI
ncbi:hypothetical protein B0T20DRAFT_478754 [Sordaria brevicollis]|uniref:Uncharacterized protein n=1 Tax=Sordaria brevicollis TaxID=83679 RepID=A0AAE0PG99_SORBR|nr:hypothetical protein B0T20DRAFT_478754 [Sordaria brevicollis]